MRANGFLGVRATVLFDGVYTAVLSLMIPAFLAVYEFFLPGVARR